VILDRVSRFLTAPESATFDKLALAAFAWQFERIEAYRRLCERRGATPETVRDWRRLQDDDAGVRSRRRGLPQQRHDRRGEE
jgi:hypothetical protein